MNKIKNLKKQFNNEFYLIEDIYLTKDNEREHPDVISFEKNGYNYSGIEGLYILLRNKYKTAYDKRTDSLYVKINKKEILTIYDKHTFEINKNKLNYGNIICNGYISTPKIVPNLIFLTQDDAETHLKENKHLYNNPRIIKISGNPLFEGSLL